MISEICKQYNIYGVKYDPILYNTGMRLIDKDGCAYMFVPREVALFNKCLRVFNMLGVIA